MFIFTSERNRGVLSINVVAGECNVSSVCKRAEVARRKKSSFKEQKTWDILRPIICHLILQVFMKSCIGLDIFHFRACRTWILNVCLFTLNVIMLIDGNGNRIYGFLGNLLVKTMLIRLLHFDKNPACLTFKELLYFHPLSYNSLHFF